MSDDAVEYIYQNVSLWNSDSFVDAVHGHAANENVGIEYIHENITT